ncbi:hypothetical protein [Granulicella arctica]|uniref:Uncharacterized protein n=1 Tax=Granulicella arctica TaxID=940613 RepID=A0A7Y9PDP1_9BACT|nr:hypothetical protein [Granulicella arctica]NYF77774.1 hypothetical protein [Granulicella arctica]
MKTGAEDKKKLGILAVVGVLGLAGAYYIYSQLFPPDVAPVPPPTVITAPAKTIPVRTSATSSGNTVGISSKANPEAQLDPTLHMEAMLVTESLVYSGSGRNIFSPNSVPEEIPNLVAKVRTPEPIAPVRTAPIGPPPPPPIDLKFFGTETNSSGSRRAFLLHGEDVFIVSSGEIVQRRYRIISVDPHSIVIEDIANNNQQTLPLQAR